VVEVTNMWKRYGEGEFAVREITFCAKCGKRTGVRALLPTHAVMVEVVVNSRSGCCNARVNVLLDVADAQTTLAANSYPEVMHSEDVTRMCDDMRALTAQVALAAEKAKPKKPKAKKPVPPTMPPKAIP